MHANFPPAIDDASAWTGADLEKNRSWEVKIGAEERSELESALAIVKAQGLTLRQLRRANFPLGPATGRLARHIVDAVKSGLGFTVIRGFPVDGHSEDDVRLMYFGLSQYLGTCVSQDPTSALVADVKEKGLARDSLTRAYGSKHPTRLHVDLADVVGLLGVRQAWNGALTRLASSTTAYNEFLRQRPELLPTAFEGFHWDRFGEQKAWEEPVSPQKIPVFSFAPNGQLSCRYNRGWITAASVRRNIPFSDKELAVLDFFEAVTRDNALGVEMRPGDVYFANNYTVLHGRDPYEEEPDTPIGKKRLFLRVWCNVPGMRQFSDEALVRFGLANHGDIGWTSQELVDGKNMTPGHERVRLETSAYS